MLLRIVYFLLGHVYYASKPVDAAVNHLSINRLSISPFSHSSRLMKLPLSSSETARRSVHTEKTSPQDNKVLNVASFYFFVMKQDVNVRKRLSQCPQKSCCESIGFAFE